MALVNPQIAMSFRPTVEYQPRNALAEYAQIQNIIGGQRQAEVAEMQLDQLRQDRDALRQIQAAIVAKGGPPDLGAAADAMIKSGRPEYLQQGLRIRETLAQQQRLEAYEREHYPTGAATPSAVPAVAAAPAAAAPAAAAAAPAATAPAAAAAAPAEGAVNALAPATAAPATTNAMRAAAQPNVDALMRRYNQAARAGSPDAPAILKQIEAALRGDQSTKVSPGEVVINRSGQVIYTAPAAPSAIGAIEAEIATLKGQGVADTDPRIVARQGKIRQLSGAPAPTEIANIEAEIATLRGQGVADTDPRIVARQGKIKQLSGGPDPAEIRTMESLGYPLTQAGYASFRAAQMRETPPALVPILRDGKPVLVPRDQAVGQTPFTPASVQVLGMGPQREAREPTAAQPRPLTAAQEAARRDKLGKEFKSATAALQTTQDVLDSISFVRAEPGLSRATGFTGTFLPSIPEGAAAAAETRLRNLEGKVTALGKAQAAATGAIGSIANQEWQILRDQIAAIDRTKGTGPLLKQLELVELQAQGAMARIRDAYQRQFGEDFERFPQFSNLPAPSSSFTPRAPAGGAGRAAPAAGGGVDTSNPLLR